MTAPACSPGTARAWVLPTRGGGCVSCTAKSSRSKCERLAAAASPPRCRFPSTTLRVAHHRRWSFVKIRTLSGDDEALAQHTLSLLPAALSELGGERDKQLATELVVSRVRVRTARLDEERHHRRILVVEVVERVPAQRQIQIAERANNRRLPRVRTVHREMQ